MQSVYSPHRQGVPDDALIAISVPSRDSLDRFVDLPGAVNRDMMSASHNKAPCVPKQVIGRRVHDEKALCHEHTILKGSYAVKIQ